MYTLGVNLSHHSSIALLKDNEVLLYIQEERLNRKKYFLGWPFSSFGLIKKYTSSIDAISILNAGTSAGTTIIRHLNSQGIVSKSFETRSYNHHEAHCAAGFYMSRMDDACVIVIDGAGSIVHLAKKDNEIIKASETTSIYDARFPNTFDCVFKKCVAGYYNRTKFNIVPQMLEQVNQVFRSREIELTTQHDIGWRYFRTTKRIGFGNNGEGKTMGLSGYGTSDDSTKEAKEAYNIQQELTKYFISTVETALSKVKSQNVVISGGCALNILGNAAIKRHFPNLNIFVDPVAADASLALGGAAELYYRLSKSTDKLICTPYKGPNYNIEKSYIYECARKYSI